MVAPCFIVNGEIFIGETAQMHAVSVVVPHIAKEEYLPALKRNMMNT